MKELGKGGGGHQKMCYVISGGSLRIETTIIKNHIVTLFEALAPVFKNYSLA